MTRLCELSAKYGSDKHLGGYTEFYDLILAGRAVKKVLEIGIGTPEAMAHVPGYQPGASLRMWADYFPDAEIFGADIDPSGAANSGAPRSIALFQSDQRKRSDLVMLGQRVGPVDLIVDDGDHSISSQIFTAVTLMPFLAPGGLYIIEDAAPDPAGLLPFEHAVVHTVGADGVTRGRCILIQKAADGQ